MAVCMIGVSDMSGNDNEINLHLHLHLYSLDYISTAIDLI
jgi:hypothetical protein